MFYDRFTIMQLAASLTCPFFVVGLTIVCQWSLHNLWHHRFIHAEKTTPMTALYFLVCSLYRIFQEILSTPIIILLTFCHTSIIIIIILLLFSHTGITIVDVFDKHGPWYNYFYVIDIICKLIQNQFCLYELSTWQKIHQLQVAILTYQLYHKLNHARHKTIC